MLLKSACLGGAFCSPPSQGSPSPMSKYHDVICKLRVLNALRAPPPEGPGVPLTLTQLDQITLPGVVSRLLAYHEWGLAFQIAGTLMSPQGLGPQSLPQVLGPQSLPPLRSATRQGLQGGAGSASSVALHSPQEQVMLHWACAKISASSFSQLSDQELKDHIMQRFKDCLPTGSVAMSCGRFAPIAAHAQSLGRYKLSLKLLEEEGSCSLQVPLLLSLSLMVSTPPQHNAQGSEAEVDVLQRALKKAIESGDVDLVYLVLFNAFKRKSASEFWTLVSSRALARNLFVKFCREREPDLLETILTVHGLTSELAEHLFRKALSQYLASSSHHVSFSSGSTKKDKGQIEALTKLTSSLTEASSKYAAASTSKGHSGDAVDKILYAKAASDLAALRREQARLERETGQSLFLGLSVVDTLRALLRLGHHKQAGGLRKTFGITERRWCWIRMRSYCELRDWEGLDDFLSEAGAVKGARPTLEVTLEMAKKSGAGRDVQLRIVSKMPDSGAKAELYQGLDAAREAAEVAAKLKDADLFGRIQALVPTSNPAFFTIQQMQQRFR